MENEPFDNQQTSDPFENKGKSRVVGFLFFLIALLLIVLGVLGWQYYQQKLDAVEIQTQLIAEKDSITQNLKNLMVEYDDMRTSNVEMNQKLLAEQAKVKEMYREIQTLKTVSYAKIKEYQRELGTLRAILKDLIKDVDSLNTMNQMLVAENIKVREEAFAVKKTVKALEQKTVELSSVVEKGSAIKAREIIGVGVNKRGTEVARARRVEKIQVCFTLTENSIAKPGSRFVYLRLTGPDDFILAIGETDVFDYQGEKIPYSAKREVDYQNKDIEMCIYYDSTGELQPGRYLISLYMDGAAIGEGEMLLK